MGWGYFEHTKFMLWFWMIDIEILLIVTRCFICYTGKGDCWIYIWKYEVILCVCQSRKSFWPGTKEGDLQRRLWVFNKGCHVTLQGLWNMCWGIFRTSSNINVRELLLKMLLFIYNFCLITTKNLIALSH